MSRFHCGLIVGALLLCGISQASEDAGKSVLATIGSTTITRQVFDNFSVAKSYFPTPLPAFFSRSGSDLTSLIETELLFAKAPSSSTLKNSNDWKWKEMFYPSQLYFQQVMEPNLCFSKAEITAFYNAHKDLFKQIIPADTAVKDSLGKVIPEHIQYTSVDDVQQMIVDSLFMNRYPVPDSLLRPYVADSVPTVDTALVRARWLAGARKNAANFFMELWYTEKFKQKSFPDSLNVWYGEGKIVTPADMKVIINWIPEEQRSNYTNEMGTKILATWLLKWKLFSEHANKAGFYSEANIAGVLSWAYKLTVVSDYLTTTILPAAQSSVVPDTAMCTYAYWDDNGNPSAQPDTAGMSGVVKRYQEKLAYIKIDAQLNELRNAQNVKVMSSEFRDDASGNPARLIIQADSARDTGNIVEAELIYRKLITSFSFTPEGIRAHSEVAKILTERQMYSEAIKYYRDFLVISSDTAKRSNTFFMIGFIYDEYQDKPELAEVNYRWVLHNAPKSELADDAEFMCLHLGEAMNSVDELRDEAVRQGKKVEASQIP